MLYPGGDVATCVHTAPSCILPADGFLVVIWLDAMQEDSAVLARAHLKLTGCDRHQPECRISGAMVTDCNAGHVWCLWHRTNLLIQVALSWTRLITTVMLSQLPVPLVHPASIDVCTMQKGVVEVEMFHSKNSSERA